MLISKFIGFVLIHLLNLGVSSILDLKDFQLVFNFNWYHTQVTFNWYMQGKQSTPPPGGMQGSKLIQLVWLSISYLILELPSCMIWPNLSCLNIMLWTWFSCYHVVHTPCGKFSSCHASFVILWSTLVIFQISIFIDIIQLDHESWN